MRRGKRFRTALGLAVRSSLAFLVVLLTRPVGDERIKLIANLAQLVAPMVAAAGCGRAAATGSGRARRAWALLAGSAGSWAIGQVTWVWYEHIPERELPFPSLADVGYLGAIPLAGAAMLAFPSGHERAALQARSVLDGAVIATSLLYTSWAALPPARAGRCHLGGAAAAGPAERPVPVLGVRLAGAADRRPSAADRARQPGPQPPARGDGGPAGAPGVPRRAHQAGQPRPVPRAGRACAAPPVQRRCSPGSAVHRPGRLQDGQRRARPRGRRRPADRRGRPAQDLRALGGHGCPAGRRRVRHPARGGISHDVAVRVAQRVLEAMRSPYQLQAKQVQIGASVGVTVSHAQGVDEVLREADVAMYMAKAHGKGRFELAAASA